jgi:hypothetical protein
MKRIECGEREREREEKVTSELVRELKLSAQKQIGH